MAASREGKKTSGAKKAPEVKERKHLTREKREEASRMAYSISKKTDSLGEAATAVSKTFGVSFTTAQSWIRRGRHLVNQAKKAKETSKR